MGDRIRRRSRKQIDLPDRKPLAQFQKPRRRKHILPGLALAQEIDAEIVTARPTGPIADNSTTYIAKSASAISVGPEMVPPGRSMLSRKRCLI